MTKPLLTEEHKELMLTAFGNEGVGASLYVLNRKVSTLWSDLRKWGFAEGTNGFNTLTIAGHIVANELQTLKTVKKELRDAKRALDWTALAGTEKRNVHG